MTFIKKISLYLLITAVSAILLAAIIPVQKSMNRDIAANHLRFTGQISNAPPAVVFSTMALGSFRGLIADILWLRSENMKQNGQYFEMVQLAKWIVDLQPNFAGASSFLAWNLAYNVSVTTSDFEQRWQWVNEGIKLLRDQAIVYNPESPKLYQELAWIYLHKLGNIMDDANLFYKNKLAIEVMDICGGNPDCALLAKFPQDEKGFKTYFSKDLDIIFTAQIPDFEALYAVFAASAPAQLPQDHLADKPELKKDVTCALQAAMFQRKFKMDVAKMAEYDRKYGRLDWRVAESFALYWASAGLAVSPPGKPDIHCQRIVTTSLYEGFRYGKLLMVDRNDFGSILVVPNLDLADSAWQAMLDAQKEFDGSPAAGTFRSARINFIKQAITVLFNYGKFQKAQEFFEKLVAEDGPQPNAANAEQFIMNNWAETIRSATVKSASEIISGLIFTSINYIVYGDIDAAVAAEKIAANIYKIYTSDMSNTIRTQLPPYGVIKQQVTTNCLKTFPPQLAEILRKYIAQENAKNIKSQEKVQTK